MCVVCMWCVLWRALAWKIVLKIGFQPMSRVLESTVISERLVGSRISGVMKHFGVVLAAIAFTHVTSTLSALPRRGGQKKPSRIVKKVGQQQTLPHAHCSVSGPCCVLLVLRAACATLCACSAHSSIGALPRLPHCFRHASARRVCCPRPTGSPTARIWCLTSRRRTIIVSFRGDVHPHTSSLLQFAHTVHSISPLV